MKPVVLIPGIFGSILTSENKVVWPGSCIHDVINIKDNIINNLSGHLDSDFYFKNWNGS